MNTIRWNVAVSADTDQSLRMFLASQGGGRKGDLSRFIEEAQVVSQLQHSNIVPIHEIGVMADRSIYFTMQVIRGKPF